MRYVKVGYISKMIESENVGFITESETGIEWMFFLDTVSKNQGIRLHSQVSFRADNDYHIELFVAKKVFTLINTLSKAV
jgi:hypothetical protein